MRDNEDIIKNIKVMKVPMAYFPLSATLGFHCASVFIICLRKILPYTPRLTHSLHDSLEEEGQSSKLAVRKQFTVDCKTSWESFPSALFIIVSQGTHPG